MAQSILVIDHDADVVRMLSQVGHSRGLDVVAVTTPAEALVHTNRTDFSVAVVDVSVDAAAAVTFLGQLQRKHPETESIITSPDGLAPLGLPPDSGELLVVLRRPVDAARLFTLVERALERHRVSWERGLLNEIAETLASSLDMAIVLPRVAEQVSDAFQTQPVVLRLRSSGEGVAPIVASVGASERLAADYREYRGEWPSDRVMAEGVTLRVDNVNEWVHSSVPFSQYAGRSLVVVPIAAADVTLGALTLGSTQVSRFTRADERLVQTIGQQIGTAVANSRLYERVRRLSDDLRVSNSELVATVERLRATQAQLVQAEKMRSIGQLVAGVAHELNNPLTSIMGYSQLVHEQLRRRAQPVDLASIAHDVQRVVVEAERAARIVRNLLTFARQHSERRTREDVADLCRRVIELREYDLGLKGVAIDVSLAPNLPAVLVDGGQIQQTLLNLVMNAEEAMAQSEERRLGIAAIAEPGCGAVLLMVSDTGHGIESPNVNRVFDPFFTTRPVGEGTGLGLSIVFGIARGHGGQVWTVSRPGGPTTFYLRLPAVDDRLSARSVLVAHADPELREYLATMCEGWGFRVATASTSHRALAAAQRQPPDVLIASEEIVRGDLPAWRTAEQTWCARTALVGAIAAPDADGDDEARQFLRERSHGVIGPSLDLSHVRPVMLAALARERSS